MTTTTSPILRQRLQLEVLNRQQRQKNLLQQGFTLVELMIVIVIVGILSAVALPNFLSQTDKAKLTEAQTASSAYLKQYYATALESTTAANNFSTDECPSETDNWKYTCDGASITATAKFGDLTAYTGSIDTLTGVVTPLTAGDGNAEEAPAEEQPPG